METEQIMSAIFLIAVLILILPAFLSTNNKINQFFKNCFILLFVDKNDGKIKINTAVKNIADIICSVSI